MKALVKLYGVLKERPPIDENGNRKMGSRIYECFWRGYEGFPAPLRTSMAYQAWKAGKDYRKEKKK